MNQNKTLYRAVDNQTIPGRFLHLSGQSLTSDKNESWLGTIEQFHRICERFEWDNLKPVNTKFF